MTTQDNSVHLKLSTCTSLHTREGKGMVSFSAQRQLLLFWLKTACSGCASAHPHPWVSSRKEDCTALF